VNNRISIDPKVLCGKPVIKGTRISVSLILELLGSGYTVEKILAEYPSLTKKDVLAAAKFASDNRERVNGERNSSAPMTT